MKVSLSVAFATFVFAGCALQPERNAELQAMERGPALAVEHVKKYCRPNGVWREVGMMITHDDGQTRPAVGVMCLSREDRLVMFVCDKTGTFCNLLPYRLNAQTLAKEEELRQLEARETGGRRL